MIISQARTAIILALLILWSTALPPSSGAETANGCHCFQDRTYNPANKFAADEYILATSFNSLISNHFNIPKREIVMLKMKGGIGHLDLLTSLYVAKISKTNLQGLISLRQRKISWQKILNKAAYEQAAKTDPHLAALGSGASLELIGIKIADSVVAEFYTLELSSLEELRSAGLNEKEMALVLILSRTKDKKPAELAQKYKKGESWSQIANGLGVEPGAAGKLIIQHRNGKDPAE